MKRNLLLISNSTLFGSEYLDHCENNIKEFLGDLKGYVAFVPYARPNLLTHEAYTDLAKQRFAKMGYKLISVTESSAPQPVLYDCDAIFIGGGNTFVLLDQIYQNSLLIPIREQVQELGKKYIGASAGANVACKTIKTTNDMPIVYPPSFFGLGLVPFNINPHYLDADPNSKHKGETRETRLNEFRGYNDEMVVALREGAMLKVIDDIVELNGISLSGSNIARIFVKGKEPTEHIAGERLDFLLK
jgi:dipeptidase E